MDTSIKRNSLYNIIYRALNVIYPLITMAYVSRILRPEGVGKISLAQNVASYFLLAAALGIPNYGIKIIGGVQKDISARNKRFTELFLINLCSTVIVFLVYLFFLKKLKNISDIELLLVFGIQIGMNIINVDWFYQGIEEYLYIAVRSIVVKIVSLIMIITFVKNKNDFCIYAFILCFAITGNYILNIVHIRKYVQLDFRSLSIKKHLKPIFILLASTFAMEIYTMLDSTMVGIICSETELAFYSNSSRLIRSVYGVLTAMTTVYLPRLSYLYRNGRQEEYKKMAAYGLKLSLFFAIPGAIGVFILSNEIVLLLFGQAFMNAIVTTRILSVLIIIFSVANIGGHIILISTNQESKILYATVCGAIVNFVFNMILIRIFHYNGAAMSSVIAETLVTVILFLSARKYSGCTIDFKYWKTLIISSVNMVLVLKVCKKLFADNLILTLGLGILVSVLVYLIFTYLTGNEIIKHMLWEQKENRHR